MPHLPLSSRPDVLTFETPVLEQDITVCGPVLLRLWVSYGALDTDFNMKLTGVHPPSADYAQGHGMIVTDGILRMRCWDSMSVPKLMTPGERYAVKSRGFPDGQSLPERPLDPVGCFVLQFPEIRRQSEYGGGGGPIMASAGRDQYRSACWGHPVGVVITGPATHWHLIRTARSPTIRFSLFCRLMR